MPYNIKLNNPNLAKVIGSIDYTPILPAIRTIVDSSIQRNFQAGGRYGNDNIFGGGSQKWVQSRAAKLRHGRTLIKTSTLLKAIRPEVLFKNGKIDIIVNINLDYANIHQYGGVVNHGAGSYRLPARPYIVLQNQDLEFIKNVITKFLKSKLSNL